MQLNGNGRSGSLGVDLKLGKRSSYIFSEAMAAVGAIVMF